MSDKTLTSVTAGVKHNERMKRDGTVFVRALPAWLKGHRYIEASLTPTEARLLAEQLLAGARQAEEAAGGAA